MEWFEAIKIGDAVLTDKGETATVIQKHEDYLVVDKIIIGNAIIK